MFFNTPLATDLRVFQEKWYARLAKVLGVFSGQDVLTGDKDFDSRFRVQGADEQAVGQVLNPLFRQAVKSFALSKPQVVSSPGAISLSRYLLSYTEGPYRDKGLPAMAEKAEPIAAALVNMAKLLEKQ